MKKVFLFAAALIVCTSFSFAADLEAESFDVYSLDPLTNSAVDYAVMPLSATSWDTSDSSHLSDIRNALCYSGTIGTPTILGFLEQIASDVGSSYFDLDSASELTNINGKVNLLQKSVDAIQTVLNTNLAYLPNLVSLQSMEYNIDYMQEDVAGILADTNQMRNDLWAFYHTYWDTEWLLNLFQVDDQGSLYIEKSFSQAFSAFLPNVLMGLMTDSVNPYTGERSLYSRIAQLQETLASDDDKALAESQKANRDEIEDSFLNGSSGATSLGASDFGDLSDVGGTVKDSISLNGQASVSSFTSGLAGADESGQGWFSAATRDSLDSVSSSVSTFSMDDPYNMSGWYDRYAWVEGD